MMWPAESEPQPGICPKQESARSRNPKQELALAESREFVIMVGTDSYSCPYPAVRFQVRPPNRGKVPACCTDF
jgi:hypothetical protein